MEQHYLDELIESFTEPDGVRIDPAVGLLVLSADELRYLAGRFVVDANLLDSCSHSNPGQPTAPAAATTGQAAASAYSSSIIARAASWAHLAGTGL